MKIRFERNDSHPDGCGPIIRVFNRNIRLGTIRRGFNLPEPWSYEPLGNDFRLVGWNRLNVERQVKRYYGDRTESH